MGVRQWMPGVITAIAIVGVGSCGIVGYRMNHQEVQQAAQVKPVAAEKAEKQSAKSSSVKQPAVKKPAQKQVKLSDEHVQYHWKNFDGRQVIDWNQPTGDHPSLQGIATKDLRIVVDQATPQRLRIYKGDQLLTQFIISTGKATDKDSHTPDGNWTIQPEHGNWFYNPSKGIESGAHNWISWKDHGVYLFHSITYKQDGKTLRLDRQGNLGKPNSDGCVQMSIPDSQWFYQNFKDRVGTRVQVIHGDQVHPMQSANQK